MADAKQVTLDGTTISFKDKYARDQIEKSQSGLYAGALANNKFYRIYDSKEAPKLENCVYLDINTYSVYQYSDYDKAFFKVFSAIIQWEDNISDFGTFVNMSYSTYSRKLLIFYAGETSEYVTHGYFYQTVKETVTPTGTENPHALAWFERISGENYRPSSDTTVNNSKTYYTFRLKSLKTFDETFTPELKTKLEKIHNGYYIGKYINGDLVDIVSGDPLPKTANWYYLDILTLTLYQYVGSAFVKVHNSVVDIIENIDTEAKMKSLAITVYENNMSIRYMGPTSAQLTHGYFYEVRFEEFTIPVSITINPAERNLYEMDGSTGTYHKTTDTEVVSGKAYFEAILEPV